MVRRQYLAVMTKRIAVAFFCLFLQTFTDAEWTRYFDVDTNNGSGDEEYIRDVLENSPRLMCHKPTRMQVQTEGGVPAFKTGEVFRVCNISEGFSCLNADQSDKLCENYQVRYCCPGEKGAEWCLTDEELKELSVVANYSIKIQEDIGLGTVVWTLPLEYMTGTDVPVNTSVAIVAGNKGNRFSIDKSAIVLSALLDADFISLFKLVLNITSKNGNVQGLQLTINVTDVDDWPPVYNTTCETNPRSDSGVSSFEPFEVIMNGRSSSESITEFDDLPNIELSNSQCDVRYSGIISRHAYGVDIRTLDVRLLFEQGSRTFSLRTDFLEEDNYTSMNQSVGSDSDLYYIGTLTVFGVDTNGPLKFFVEPYFRESGKTMFGRYGPLELKTMSCPKGRYGGKCQYECVCKNDAACHIWNGACKCSAGWGGPACDMPLEVHAALDLHHSKDGPVQMYSNAFFVCTITNLQQKYTLWVKNGVVMKERPLKIFFGRPVNSLSTLTVANVTKQDSGNYKCIVHGIDVVVESNVFDLQVEGCQENVWGHTCDRSCDCMSAVHCLQSQGCVCKPGWNGRHCEFDIQQPEIENCPGDITVSSRSENSVNVWWNTLNVTDNAGPPSITSNYISGDKFHIGTTDVAFNVSDGLNHVYCSFTVTVLDEEAPQIRCPPSVKFYTEAHDDVTVVNWTLPIASDNSNTITLSSTHSPGEKLSTGSYAITYNASDPSGNTESCSFFVTVQDLPSGIYWLTIFVAIAAGVSLVVVALVFLFLRKRTRQKYTYMALDDVFTLPDDILKVSLKDLTVLHQIGQGEFSTVKSGKLFDSDDGVTDVAVKILRGNGSESLYSFREECERLNDLKNHEHIIRLVGVVLEPSKKYILTELMQSDLLNVLTDLRGDKTMNNDKRLVKYSIGIALALKHMECIKIVHRDIAARNILISHEDVAKVGDFGFARDVYQTGEYHRHQGRPGRFPTRWMAPESLTDGIYSYKTDVWSFGILLWEIATLGAAPRYTDVDDCNSKLLGRHLVNGNRLPMPQECSIELFRLMGRCWYTQPRDRSTADVIFKELSQFRNLDKRFFI
ncbi:uncharacterized protein [Ptychodera flava]|uniref:uncharacterized protein n=1 Tax=Ptychodera flava TaxID=63121 RepID=UPI00396A8F62